MSDAAIGNFAYALPNKPYRPYCNIEGYSRRECQSFEQDQENDKHCQERIEGRKTNKIVPFPIVGKMTLPKLVMSVLEHPIVQDPAKPMKIYLMLQNQVKILKISLIELTANPESHVGLRSIIFDKHEKTQI